MGYTYYPDNKLNGIKGVLQKEGKLSLHAHLIDKAYCPEYHTSWDWLMPVVEKIENLDAAINIDSGNVFLHFPIEYNKEHIRFDYEESGTSKINAVYSAVTKFLTYINEKK